MTYAIDANGILHVSAEEKTSKLVKEITIVNDKGRLSDDQVKRMCDEARDFKEKDKEEQERAYGDFIFIF